MIYHISYAAYHMKKYLAKFTFADNAYNVQHMGCFFKVHFVKTITVLGGDQINNMIAIIYAIELTVEI